MWLMAYSLIECIYPLRYEISLHNLLLLSFLKYIKVCFMPSLQLPYILMVIRLDFKRCLIGFLKGVS